MAGMDYANCDYCGKGKVFYDADINWERLSDLGRVGKIRIMCNECHEKGVSLDTPITYNNNYNIHFNTIEFASTLEV